MESIKFNVQGSAATPYVVSISRIDGILLALCTCDAGINGMHCKHRIRILQGSTEDVIDPSPGDFATALGWLPGTPLEAALAECVALQTAAEALQKSLKSAKKRLAHAMLARI